MIDTKIINKVNITNAKNSTFPTVNFKNNLIILKTMSITNLAILEIRLNKNLTILSIIIYLYLCILIKKNR